VRKWLCVKTELGAEGYLELGLAYVADGKDAAAQVMSSDEL
jgi:hypothetical protein